MSITSIPRCVPAYGATAPDAALAPLEIPRRDPLPTDVVLEILFCGVCHSDLHMARNEWKMASYPVVPGHEIVGRVTQVGAEVTTFKIGDLAGVGCLVDSCRTCPSCSRGLEQYCTTAPIFTYNSDDRFTGRKTYGGYSESIVVDKAFALHISDKLDLAATAPLLCAGITTYSPLKHWKVGPGQRVGIVGLGGLGHMGVKFARAMGAHVTLFTTSASKVNDGLRLGADEVVISTDSQEMGKRRGTFDFILDAVSASHDINAYLDLVKLDGTVTLVGLPENPLSVGAFNLVAPRKNLTGSCIGGLGETQEMLDFCAEHQIVSDVEMIPIQKINEAYERMIKSDVKYRFVIDMASLKTA